MRWALLVVLVIGRVAWAQTVVPWPSPLPDRAWRVGQWVQYRADGREEFVSVIGEDSCGTWIEWTNVTGKTWDRLTVCFDDSKRVARVIRSGDTMYPYEVDVRGDNGTKQFIETRVRALITQPETFAADHVDLDLPFGRFEQAVHDAKEPGAWFHPAVPLAGLIKDTDDFVIVGFGTSRRVARDLATLLRAPPPRVPPAFISLGFGWDRFSGRAGMAADASYGFHMTAGVRLSRRFDAVAVFLGGEAQGDNYFRAQLGVRWNPFRAPPDVLPERLEWTAVFVQGQLGYAGLQRDGENVAAGLGIGLTIGWLPLRRLDWAIGFEAGGDAGVFTGGEGGRTDLWFATVFQLFGI